MIKKINFQLPKSKIISKRLKELLLLPLLHIGALEHKPLNTRISINQMKQPATTNSLQPGIIRKIHHLLIKTTSRLYAPLQRRQPQIIGRKAQLIHRVADLRQQMFQRLVAQLRLIDDQRTFEEGLVEGEDVFQGGD